MRIKHSINVRNGPIKIIQLMSTLAKSMILCTSVQHCLLLLFLGLFFNRCAGSSSNGKGNKPRSRSLSDRREGLRQIIVEMPSPRKNDEEEEQESSSDSDLGKADSPTTRYVGVFDLEKSKIHVLQQRSTPEPELPEYQMFPGSPITLATLRRNKEERRRAHEHLNPFKIYDDSSASSSDSDCSDTTEGQLKQYLRRRGHSLGSYPEKKLNKKEREREREFRKYRENEMKKDREREKAREKEREKERKLEKERAKAVKEREKEKEKERKEHKKK